MGTAAAESKLIHARTYANIIETTFNTPLVRLDRMAPKDSNVLLKMEFFNPMASVKDRIGRAMIEAAEQAGTINKDTHIVEPTSGNTGIALAFVCAAKGYQLTLTMPESMSVERRSLLKAMGANLTLTPADQGMKGAITEAANLVASGQNTWMPQQFENPANPEIHEKTTGAEIWNDTDGKRGHDGHGRGNRRHHHRRDPPLPKPRSNRFHCHHGRADRLGRYHPHPKRRSPPTRPAQDSRHRCRLRAQKPRPFPRLRV